MDPKKDCYFSFSSLQPDVPMSMSPKKLVANTSFEWLGAAFNSDNGISVENTAGYSVSIGLGLDLANNKTIPFITGRAKEYFGQS